MANWVVHSKWSERNHDGTQNVDLDGAGTTVNIGIVTESTINPDTDTLFATLTVVTGTGSTPVALANKTCGLSAGDLIFDADNPATIAQSGSGFSNGRTLVLYETVSDHIISTFIADAVFGNVAAALDITFDAAGIWKQTI